MTDTMIHILGPQVLQIYGIVLVAGLNADQIWVRRVGFGLMVVGLLWFGLAVHYNWACPDLD